jgi:hypothetical protein
MSPRRGRALIGFAVFAILTILGLYVVDGVAAGLMLLAALFVFIASCIQALSVQEPGAVASSHRIGITGWFGGWF